MCNVAIARVPVNLTIFIKIHMLPNIHPNMINLLFLNDQKRQLKIQVLHQVLAN
jgi:hypothetical protein